MFIFTIVLITVLTGVEIDLFVPSFPELQEVFNLTPFMVAMTLSVNLIAHCLAALVAGNFGDKYGHKPVMVIGLCIFVIGSLFCVFASSYYMLLFGRLLQGIGISGPSVLCYVLLLDKYKKKQQLYMMGLVNGVVTVAMAGAPVIGSYTNLFFNWRGNFIILLILGVVSLVFSVLFIPNKHLKQDIKISLSEYKPVLKSRKAMLYLVTLTLACQAYWVFIGMSPILYMQDFKVSLENFGLYQGAIAATFAAGSFSSSYLLKRYSAQSCFTVASYLVVVFFISVLAITILDVKDPLIITIVMIIQAISMVYPINILWPLALDSVPNAKVRVGALLVTLRLAVSAIAIQIASYFYDCSFFAIGTTIYLTLGVSMIACYVLLKDYNVLHSYDE